MLDLEFISEDLTEILLEPLGPKIRDIFLRRKKSKDEGNENDWRLLVGNGPRRMWVVPGGDTGVCG